MSPFPLVILKSSLTPPSASIDALRINLSLFNKLSSVVSLPFPPPSLPPGPPGIVFGACPAANCSLVSLAASWPLTVALLVLSPKKFAATWLPPV